jgi:methylated-DNA-[protein]-cysteine S-methyltransferase
MEETIYHQLVDSPIGSLRLIELAERLIGLCFEGSPPAELKRGLNVPGAIWVEQGTPLLTETARQVEAYFKGRRQCFDLPLGPRGTPFQHRAWDALKTIPYGATISYSDQAERIGGRQFCRAVGQANRHNPLPLIIPCHRVIGRDGRLTGFASGLGIKQWLIDHEREHMPVSSDH